MTQKDKELLLKDLCTRLPYDVKCKIEMWVGYDVCTIYNINAIGYVEIVEDFDTNGVSIERVKPYLFPLSSMTEEQKKEFDQCIELELKAINGEIDPTYATAFEVDFYNKHHFDWRGLIPLGLAIDATGLNIY